PNPYVQARVYGNFAPPAGFRPHRIHIPQTVRLSDFLQTTFFYPVAASSTPKGVQNQANSCRIGRFHLTRLPISDGI
ncbi:UNVERIFIED_CONTAM: hypothetical protein KB576_10845, partial [Streptococcus canis]